MDRKLEKGANLKFCINLGRSATGTLSMLRQAYGNEAMSLTSWSEWHVRFGSGRTSMEDDERFGRTVTGFTPANVEKIYQLVHEDGRRTINGIADVAGLSSRSMQAIVTSELRRVPAKFVLCLLTTVQKEHRFKVCLRATDDPSFMSLIITGDESWVYGYDHETKQRSEQRKSSTCIRPKRARQSRSSLQSMLIVLSTSAAL
ncbi:protein GVQW3-like [Octopus sinensis]|uniref:Protein GVQW3-like n=1 Tax=Octopus sinensis TaxID=2607531 RepID=A0A6P7TPB6_9MOLL|nr:protein GVQW3-like [Octopus sinensis]